MKTFIHILLVVAGAVFGPSWAVAAPLIQVQASAEVRTNPVRLGDVARISGMSEADEARLAAIELGAAPMVGTGRLLPRAFLQSAIQDAGPPRGTVLRLPARLELERKAARLESSVMRREIEAAVRADLGEVVGVAAVKVPQLSDLQMPAGARLQVDVAASGPGARSVSATVRILDGAQVVRTQQVVVQIDRLETAWILRHEVARGQPVVPSDLEAVQRPSSEMTPDAVRNPSELQNATARRDLRAGEPVLRRSVELPPMVARGHRVTLVAQTRAIRLSALGEALAAGHHGDTIRVRNLDSQKIVTGRIVGPQTVEMEL